MNWPVAVFAHNEESNIVRCLESVRRASSSAITAYVLANGCSDRTLGVVNEYAQRHSWVRPVAIDVGDKANAWNVFVHEVAHHSDAYFFVDGDVTVLPGAFDALGHALKASTAANASAAVPSSGRHCAEHCRYVTDYRLILGNLYALGGDFVRRLQGARVRLPRGYIGDDGLLTSLAKWNLDPTGSSDHDRVVPCQSAKFSFRSLSPWIAGDQRLYWRRRVRYSLRHFQHELLAPLLIRNGIRAMPESVAELYARSSRQIQKMRPRLGSDFIFDAVALHRIRAMRGSMVHNVI